MFKQCPFCRASSHSEVDHTPKGVVKYICGSVDEHGDFIQSIECKARCWDNLLMIVAKEEDERE